LLQTLVSLIPTIITIFVAYKSRKVWLALLCGVVSGGLLYGRGTGIFLTTGRYLASGFTDPERLKITFFVLMVAGMLHVMARTGANLKFGLTVGKRLPGPRTARLTAVGVSSLLFFDDYANVLIAGASMRPVMERHRISPAMLAYFTDVMAALASVVLISTWAAFEVSLIGGALKEAGSGMSGMEVFISAVPYHIFTFFNIFLVLLAAFSGRWFSIRKREHHRVVKTEGPGDRARRRDMVIPITALVGVSFFGMTGLGWLHLSAGTPFSLMAVFGAAPVIDALNLGAVTAVILLAVLMLKDNVMSWKEFSGSFSEGVKAMWPTGLVIILARGLEMTAGDLETGRHMAGLFSGLMQPGFLPAVIFVIAALVTVASGFSWSSMALIMPIAVQMALPAGEDVLFGAVAATISGAICGAQMIPYSDKSVMTAAACGITPLYHVKTQSPQIFIASLTALAGFLALGSGVPLALVVPAGFFILLSLHFFFARPFSA
jgi:Na+/H+ antiporter NhaC